ncbi:5,10-methylenetetrahydrofolate reductase [Tepidicaulis marinus]|uniref:Methylenetetrahydrofolate reductase n=2 Tax=Tepidicaulis marinus TaxID=1333998 RepID=A0A081BF62_9HYPH|nr:5,10-methylenetetrahydrofolate reductase [Tepidicaulis marinus]
MVRLGDKIRGREDLRVSFEFFPPKTEKMEETLWDSIKRLEPLQPNFVSVTYGAGGSTRERTHATVARIVKETSLKPAAHLTCVGASREEVDEVVQAYWDAGIRHIVALRGDMPELGTPYKPHEKGYQSVPELIRGIKAIGDFEVSVSAYPERHPESPDGDADLRLLQDKIEAGATRAITQFTFDSSIYGTFMERVEKAGIKVPIVPGIMPTTNFKGISRMAEKCGATVPGWLADYYEGLDDDLTTRKLIAAAVAVEQVHDLERMGFRDFHFYTLNQADLTYAICHILGLKPSTKPTPGLKAAE